MAYTNADWASTVLSDAKLPVTPNNVGNIMRWMTSEEPTSNWFHNNNPLNINAGGSGSDPFGSLNASAAETAVYLNMPNYTGIKSALASNADVNTFSAAVVASPWAAGHYGGNPQHIAQIPIPSIVNAPTGQVPGTSGVAPAGGVAGGGAGGGLTIPNPLDLGATSLTILSASQEMTVKGWFFIISGGAVAAVGMAVILATFGLESKLGRVVGGATIVGKAAGAGGAVAGAAQGAQEPPPQVSEPEKLRIEKRQAEKKEAERQQRREERVQDRIRVEQEKGSQRRATDAARERTRVQGAHASRRYIPPAGSRERRERASQPF